MANAGLFGHVPRHRAAKAVQPAVFPVMRMDAEWRSHLIQTAESIDSIVTWPDAGRRDS